MKYHKPTSGSVPLCSLMFSCSYTLLGSKTTAKRSAISIHAPIIRDVVNATHLYVVDGACAVRLNVIFIFCEFRLIANKNFFKNLLVLSSSLNYLCLKQTSWKFANTDNWSLWSPRQKFMDWHRQSKFDTLLRQKFQILLRNSKSVTCCRFHVVAVIQSSYA